MRWKTKKKGRKFGVEHKFAFLPVKCQGFGGHKIWVWWETIFVRRWARLGHYIISYYTPERMSELIVRKEAKEVS